MVVKVENRFGEFRKDLEKPFSKERAFGISVTEMSLPAQQFLKKVAELAPEGESAPIGGRPSLRIWGTTLMNAWQTPWSKERDGKKPGAVTFMGIDHPSVDARGDIIDWLIEGTDPHTIEGVRFHWGAPLRWNPKDGLPVGTRSRAWVGSSHVFKRNHWASPGRNFVALAAEKTEKLFEDARETAADRILNEPLEDSEFLRRTR